MSADLATTFGANLKRLRESRGWSQSEFARQMQEAGWPKYSQVAVSRTEEGNRVVRLDEAIGLAGILDSTITQMISPPESHVGWIHELQRQASIVVSAAKSLNDAAQAYERARQTAWARHAWITSRAKNQRAANTLMEKLEKELRQLSDVLELSAYDLLEWVEDKELERDLGED